MKYEKTMSEEKEMAVENFTIFMNDESDSMHFVVQLKDAEEREKICKLIDEHFGTVHMGRMKIGPYSAVLVEDDVLSWGHSGDVFKVSYIYECIKRGVVLDISKFLKSPSREFVENFNFMDVVFFRKYTWDQVPNNYRIKKELDSDIDSDSESVKSSSTSSHREKCTKDPYSVKEREVILKYVLNHFQPTFRNTLKGRQLWIDLENADLCPKRTWQSMKEHFLKKMVRELDSFKWLSETQKQSIRSGLK